MLITKPPKFGYFIILILALSFTIVGSYYLGENLKLAKPQYQFDGIVSHNQKVRGSKGSISYLPVINFNYYGKRITKKAKLSSSPPSYHSGDRVKVFYRPEVTDKVLINTPFRIYLFPSIFIAVGLFMLLVFKSILNQSRKYDRISKSRTFINAAVKKMRLKPFSNNQYYQIELEWSCPFTYLRRKCSLTLASEDLPVGIESGAEITLRIHCNWPSEFIFANQDINNLKQLRAA
jgi:hypothetical protein